MLLRTNRSMLSKIQGMSRTQQITRASGNSRVSSGSLVHHIRLVLNTTSPTGMSS